MLFICIYLYYTTHARYLSFAEYKPSPVAGFPGSYFFTLGVFSGILVFRVRDTVTQWKMRMLFRKNCMILWAGINKNGWDLSIAGY